MSDVALNPPERKQQLSDKRVAEIGQAAAAMPHDVPVAGWLGALCADLLDLRAALWQRVVSIGGDPAKTFYQCRICEGVDPARNPQGFTNVGHQPGCAAHSAT